MRYAHSLGSMSAAGLDIKPKEPLDFIYLVLQILEHVLTWGDAEDENRVSMPFLLLKSEKKHQRAYIIKSSQIVSFSFPFNVYSKVDSTGKKQWHIHYKDLELSPLIVSECKGIYSDVKINRNKTYQEIAASLDLDDTNILIAIKLFEALMLLEPGYLRYDYDPNGCRGLKHPLNHIDINYIPYNHYKIGLYQKLTLSRFERITNLETDSWYIDQHRENSKDNQKMMFYMLKQKKGK